MAFRRFCEAIVDGASRSSLRRRPPVARLHLRADIVAATPRRERPSAAGPSTTSAAATSPRWPGRRRSRSWPPTGRLERRPDRRRRRQAHGADTTRAREPTSAGSRASAARRPAQSVRVGVRPRRGSFRSRAGGAANRVTIRPCRRHVDMGFTPPATRPVRFEPFRTGAVWRGPRAAARAGQPRIRCSAGTGPRAAADPSAGARPGPAGRRRRDGAVERFWWGAQWRDPAVPGGYGARTLLYDARRGRAGRLRLPRGPTCPSRGGARRAAAARLPGVEVLRYIPVRRMTYRGATTVVEAQSGPRACARSLRAGGGGRGGAREKLQHRAARAWTAPAAGSSRSFCQPPLRGGA